MRRILIASMIATAGLSAVPCSASTLGAESTGTIGVTVVIPPLGDAVRAQENGATGLWSIVNGNDGLMIDASVNLTDEHDLEVNLFSPAASELRVRSYAGRFAVGGKPMGGSAQLHRTTVTLPLSDLSLWTYNPQNDRSKLYVIGTV